MKKLLEHLEHFLEWGGIKKDIALLIISGTALILSLTGAVSLPFDIAWIAIILCGVPIILEAIIGLITAFDIKADVLVSLALIAAVCIGEDFAAGEVAFIMQIGALLEDLTVAKARAGIKRLVQLTPQTARVIKNGEGCIIPAEKVQIGDLLRVLPGEGVPVDGIIVSGQTAINQGVMTGEPLPVDKTVGDEVASGTVNQFGAFEMKATKVGEDSSIQRMIRLVQSADADKAKIVRLTDKWATWIVVAALSAAALTWLITGEIIRAVTILVVFCPCALVLAAPTAIMAAIGNASKHGFLVRESDGLERLAQVKMIAFDKTGTLTHGSPQVIAVKSVTDCYTNEELFFLAASAEQLSEHPLARAVVNSFRTSERLVGEANDFSMLPGKGISAIVSGKKVIAGNIQLLTEQGISVGNISEISEYMNQGCTIIHLAIDKMYAGYIVLADTLRQESSKMIEKIKKTGARPVLLTGDNKNASENIAAKLGIIEVHSECLPEDKLKYIDEYQKRFGIAMPSIHAKICNSRVYLL